MSISDIVVAEMIFGPNIGAFKGKTTKPQPPLVLNNNIEIPVELKEQHHDIALCIDIMYINGIPMLTSIDKSVHYRIVVPIENRTHKELYTAIDKIFRRYNKAIFTITEINCDQEF